MRGWTGVEQKSDTRWAFKCPEDHCYFVIGMSSPDGDTSHKCPYMGTTTRGWSITMGLVEEIWGFLDAEVDVVKSADADEAAKKEAGNKARAYCKTLVLFMQPIFNTEDDIARESMRRWRARQNGDTTYETPGWLHSKFKTLMDGDVWYKSVAGAWTSDPSRAAGPPAIHDDAILNRFRGVTGTAPKVTPDHVAPMAAPIPSPPKAKAKLDPEIAQAIRLGVTAGFFTEQELARTYGLTVEQVHEVATTEE